MQVRTFPAALRRGKHIQRILNNMTAPENTFTYRIGGMDLLSCNMAEPAPGFAPDHKMNFNVQLKHQIMDQESAIGVICIVKTTHDESGQELASFSGRMVFQVDGLAQHTKKDDNGQIGLPKSLINTLNGVAISTMRGVMWSTFKGTYLHRAVLPVVNPEGFAQGQSA